MAHDAVTCSSSRSVFGRACLAMLSTSLAAAPCMPQHRGDMWTVSRNCSRHPLWRLTYRCVVWRTGVSCEVQAYLVKYRCVVWNTGVKYRRVSWSIGVPCEIQVCRVKYRCVLWSTVVSCNYRCTGFLLLAGLTGMLALSMTCHEVLLHRTNWGTRPCTVQRTKGTQRWYRCCWTEGQNLTSSTSEWTGLRRLR